MADRSVSLPYLDLESQLRLIFSLQNFLFFGSNTLRACYSTLQTSIGPGTQSTQDLNGLFFTSYCDGFCFGPWSSSLEGALKDLVDKGEVTESLWADHLDPIHRIYHLSATGITNANRKGIPEDVLTEIESTVIAWNGLRARYAVYWMYLLEAISFGRSGESDNDFSFSIPELYAHEINELESVLSLHGIGKLVRGPSVQLEEEDIIRPHVFTGRMSETQIHQFFEYLSFVGKKHKTFSVNQTSPNTCQINVLPNRAEHRYECFRLNTNEVQDRLRALKHDDAALVLKLPERLTRYLEQNLKRSDVDLFWQQYKMHEDSIKNLSNEVRHKAIEKRTFYLSILEKYLNYADWRHTQTLKTADKLLDVVGPITITLGSFTNQQIGQQFLYPSDEYTVLWLEPNEGFYRDMSSYLKQENMAGFHFGILNHLEYLIQPVEVLRLATQHKLIPQFKDDVALAYLKYDGSFRRAA